MTHEYSNNYIAQIIAICDDIVMKLNLSKIQNDLVISPENNFMSEGNPVITTLFQVY